MTISPPASDDKLRSLVATPQPGDDPPILLGIHHQFGPQDDLARSLRIHSDIATDTGGYSAQGLDLVTPLRLHRPLHLDIPGHGHRLSAPRLAM